MAEVKNETPISIEEELDTILTALLSNKVNSSFADQQNSGHTIALLCEILGFSKEIRHVNYLAELLASDRYTEPINPIFPPLIRISPAGIRFIVQGGYVQELENNKKQEEEKRLEMQLKKTSISANLWNRVGVIFGLVISITSLILSIIAINKE